MKHCLIFSILAMCTACLSESMVEQQQVVKLTNEWNQLLNDRNLEELLPYYAPIVVLYEKEMTKVEALAAKQDFFDRNPTFFQSLDPIIDVEILGNGKYRSNFKKTTVVNNREVTLNAYLIWKTEGTKTLILEEGESPD